ncbi:MAG: AAA family ATPase [Deltaproteobacteria bacterium]|nr:AAA family ATPase [Deltaproteobacteria bacterium]
MRILGVRFKNLNSLIGEWNIDFTYPDYSFNGIFAITGPTGAGKTTIMDALCLGLYGRTPRLDKVTKSSNEIMSRQTGECFAEVTFETQKGCYRCHWSQHRARRRSDGELQQAKHEIADAENGTVLESRITQVNEFIEKVTGMDFERFTRSMLLAQGGFAAFLQASPDKRAPILEQITGTEIYSHISVKVHERSREELEKLELLQAELKGIQVLSAEEEKNLQTDLKEKQSYESERSVRLECLRKAAVWLETVAVLEKGICELDKYAEDLEKRSKMFEPEGLRLEKSRRALGLEGEYRGVTALRDLQKNETKELHDTLVALPLADKVCEGGVTIKKAAEAGLEEERKRQQSEADVIKKVRDLDARLSEQKRQIKEKDKSISSAEKQGKAYTVTIDTASKALQKSQDGLNVILDYQAAHAGDALLVNDLAAISRVFTSLRNREERHIKIQETRATAARGKEAAIAAHKTIEADHEKSRKEFERQQGDLKVLTEKAVSVLKGRELGQWHKEQSALKEREGLLRQISGTIEKMGKASAALDKLNTRQGILKAGHEKLSGEIKTCTDKKALLEGTVAAMETQVSLLCRIRDLEEERTRLEDGTPCPLCGALDHPYAQGNVPELNTAEKELKDAKADFKQVVENLSKLEAEQAKMLAEIGYVEKERDEKKAALDADGTQCTDTMLKLNIKAAPEERAVKVLEALADAHTKIAAISGIIVAAEEINRKEKAAQDALQKLRMLLEGQGTVLQDARYNVETAGHEHERLSREVEAFGKELEKARASALKDVEPFGIRQISSTDLDTILKGLTARKDTWQANVGEKTGLDKKINDMAAAIDKDKALLEKLEHDLKESCEGRKVLNQKYESQSASRRELYGEKNPDQEEKRLVRQVDQAGKVLEGAREEHAKVEKALNSLKEKRDDLEKKTRTRAIDLVQVEKNLTDRIKKAGFENESDYVSALLTEKERERLGELEKDLIREKTEMEARRKDKTAALAAEREKHLTDQTVETVKKDIDTVDSDLKLARIDIGGMIKTLSENEKLHERQQERIKKIDAQKTECNRWDDLHLLIGSADGKKFRNFAQGLTFEMMTTQANRQLRKMTDRYLLIRDVSQPLELNVIDNYQAGEIRSTKNLSGGESFIVSLALALGLSQMASRNVRVDSLFLDEGFGTLDDDALETALETLAGLQQDGKLIGVISHVTALKERIGTQIEVIPETGGRSSLSGPGCRRN